MNQTRLKSLLDRLNRAVASAERSDSLNPAQRAALDYLARANRFSRAPSHVAAYLCTTRGTASQTLKALERKGFVSPTPKPHDRRSITYEITDAGRAALSQTDDLDVILNRLPKADAAAAERILGTVLRDMLAGHGHVLFGICRFCAHHHAAGGVRHCRLLDVPLGAADAGALCHEYSVSSAA